MRPADNINESIKKLHVKASADLDKRVHDDISRALAESAPPEPNIWRIIMKSRITKLAAAAVIMIACVIGLSLWRTTGSGIALADVLARIEKVKAFRYQWSAKTTGEDPNKPYSSETRGTCLISQEYGKKSKKLDPNGGESTFGGNYFSPEKKTMIIIRPKEKQYWRIEVDDGYVKKWQNFDPRTFLKKILASKYESLGRSTIDGIEVEGFRTTDPNWYGNSKNKVEVDVKMWVDVKTWLPVRYEDTIADLEGDKIIRRDYFVEHDFQWDVVVDAAEFEPPPIPDDYTSLRMKTPLSGIITEETVIQGLKLLVELLGKYPDIEIITYFDVTTLRSAFEKSETPAAMRLKEEIKGLTEEEINNKLVDFLMPIQKLVKFCDQRLFWGGFQLKYYGKTVTPKDADKVLMRWNFLGTGSEYRVIYGDLHAETVTPEKLAELEAALPK